MDIILALFRLALKIGGFSFKKRAVPALTP
jgi:hypothetical protein